MTAGVHIDESSTVAPFEQVRTQLAAGIGDGSLVAGTRLPSVRALAQELGLATNTVARSYRELEMSGLVETRGRGGTIVTAAGDEGRARLRDAAVGYAALAHAYGVGGDEALEVVRVALGVDA